MMLIFTKSCLFGRYETVKSKIANIKTSLNKCLRNEKSEWQKLHSKKTSKAVKTKRNAVFEKAKTH